MRYAFGLMIGRLIATAGMACTALTLAGCSSGTSRFDFPAFNLTGSSETQAAQPADYSTTAALPVPQESVYNSDYPASSNNTQLAHGTPLPPLPSSYRPQATPASYTPAPAPVTPRAYPRPMAPTPAPVLSAPAAPKPPGPNDAVYRVESGDTPGSIAQRFGVSQKSILVRNDIRADRLQIGQRLIIPGGKTAAQPRPTVAANAPEPIAAPPAMGGPSPSGASPSDVRVVKTTTIPAPGATSLAAESAREAEGAPTMAPAGSNLAAANNITGEPKTMAPATGVTNPGQLPTPDPMSGNSFRWPVQGRVISGFGTKPDGGHNDGINVAVPQGTPVKAAENGVVAYSGSELKGYGNLVLVRHANNWVSAYAHNNELLVKRGEKVRRGQVIAKAGATGSVSQPQVHFELRKGSRPIDPTKFMNSMTANAD
jgi:murein DD-endopeptidase MepM/ murein hydrolase activator NlpD